MSNFKIGQFVTYNLMERCIIVDMLTSEILELYFVDYKETGLRSIGRVKKVSIDNESDEVEYEILNQMG